MRHRLPASTAVLLLVLGRLPATTIDSYGIVRQTEYEKQLDRNAAIPRDYPSGGNSGPSLRKMYEAIDAYQNGSRIDDEDYRRRAAEAEAQRVARAEAEYRAAVKAETERKRREAFEERADQETDAFNEDWKETFGGARRGSLYSGHRLALALNNAGQLRPTHSAAKYIRPLALEYLERRIQQEAVYTLLNSEEVRLNVLGMILALHHPEQSYQLPLITEYRIESDRADLHHYTLAAALALLTRSGNSSLAPEWTAFLTSQLHGLARPESLPAGSLRYPLSPELACLATLAEKTAGLRLTAETRRAVKHALDADDSLIAPFLREVAQFQPDRPPANSPDRLPRLELLFSAWPAMRETPSGIARAWEQALEGHPEYLDDPVNREVWLGLIRTAQAKVLERNEANRGTSDFNGMLAEDYRTMVAFLEHWAPARKEQMGRWHQALREFDPAKGPFSEELRSAIASGWPEGRRYQNGLANSLRGVRLRDANSAAALAHCARAFPQYITNPGQRIEAAYALWVQAGDNPLPSAELALIRSWVIDAPEGAEGGTRYLREKVLLGVLDEPDLALPHLMHECEAGRVEAALPLLVQAHGARLAKASSPEELGRMAAHSLKALGDLRAKVLEDDASNAARVFRQSGADDAVWRLQEEIRRGQHPYPGVRDFNHVAVKYDVFNAADILWLLSEGQKIEREMGGIMHADIERVGAALIAKEELIPLVGPSLARRCAFSPWEGEFELARFTRTHARLRAEALTSALLALKGANETDLEIFKARISDLLSQSVVSAGTPAVELMGRDLDLGGLGTRTFLAMGGSTRGDLAAFAAEFIAKSFELPAVLPPETVIDLCAKEAVNGDRLEEDRHAALYSLAAAGERRPHSNAARLRRQQVHALETLEKLSPTLIINDRNLAAGMASRALTFLQIRARWELEALAHGYKAPAERARFAIGNNTADLQVLAELCRTGASRRTLPQAWPYDLVFEPDPEFAPAIVAVARDMKQDDGFAERFLQAKPSRHGTSWTEILAAEDSVRRDSIRQEVAAGLRDDQLAEAWKTGQHAALRSALDARCRSAAVLSRVLESLLQELFGPELMWGDGEHLKTLTDPQRQEAILVLRFLSEQEDLHPSDLVALDRMRVALGDVPEDQQWVYWAENFGPLWYGPEVQPDVPVTLEEHRASQIGILQAFDADPSMRRNARFALRNFEYLCRHTPDRRQGKADALALFERVAQLPGLSPELRQEAEAAVVRWRSQ